MDKQEEQPKINGDKTKGKPEQDPETGKFLPGNCGGGRPKGSVSIVTVLKRLLGEVPEGEDRDYATILATNILRDALRGRGGKDKLILQYIDGMPVQTNLLGGTDGGPVPIIYVSESTKKD